MVTSAATTMSGIPTGVNSPRTGGGSVFYITPSGSAYGYGRGDYNSYGHLVEICFQIYSKYWWLRSPLTVINHDAWIVTSSGVLGVNSNDVGIDSYGFIRINLSIITEK